MIMSWYYYYRHHFQFQRLIARIIIATISISTITNLNDSVSTGTASNSAGVTTAFAFQLLVPVKVPSKLLVYNKNKDRRDRSSPSHLGSWMSFKTTTTKTCLYYDTNGSNDDGRKEDDDEEENTFSSSDNDIQSARKQLEALLYDKKKDSSLSTTTSTSKATETQTSKLDPTMVSNALAKFPPPLTAIGRTRYDAELKYLSFLKTSDVLTDLLNLWSSERGPEACAELEAADQLMMTGRSRPQDWDLSESKLRSLIDQYGLEWAEPINRLATLMYIRGNYKESKRLCEIVLTIKPWHFSALIGIVMVCTALHDVNEAQKWSNHRLPPLNGDNIKQRIQWIEHAIKEATEMKQRAEEQVWENVDNDDDDDDITTTTTSMDKQDGTTTTTVVRSTAMGDPTPMDDDDEGWQ